MPADTPGIFEQRRSTLSSFFDVAQYAFHLDASRRSVMLSCAQYWCDEASDAVQEDIRASKELVPMYGMLDSLEYEQKRDFDWQPNSIAVWGFAAMCNEEGWVDGDGTFDPSLVGTYIHHDSPLMLVQRLDDQLHASWLGSPLRGWLDFPGSWTERDYSGGGALPVPVPDPPPAPLAGREVELYEQAVVDRGAREVLRDLWIERGDPRGELSVAIRSGDEARIAELIARHGRAWLGELQHVIPLSGARFGDGPFVEEAYVYTDRETFHRVADAPEWSALDTLTFARGGYRALVPRMKPVRAIGPLAPTELAPLMEPGWSVEDLDVDLGAAPANSLSRIAAPLRVLRLRVPVDLGPVSLAALAREAAWWSTLERLELWIPGVAMGGTPERGRIATIFDAALPELPPGATLAVGALDSGRRTGWMLKGDASTRGLELIHPDSRVHLGPMLAEELGLTLEAPVISLPNWLTLGLGVPSTRPAPKP